MPKEPTIADQPVSTSIPLQTGHGFVPKPLRLKHPSDAAASPAEGRTMSKTVQLIGCLLVFCAAALFYLSTATIRWAAHHVSLDPAFFVFVRFVAGFVLVNLILLVKRQSLHAKRYDLLAGRAVANAVAVYCFYTAVSKTTLAEANILNMTYPVFVAVFSLVFLKQQRDTVMAIGALIAFVGIWLVLARGPLSLGWNHLWGLASGVCAAWAIIFLNLSRRYHDTQTVLFYLFGLGAILTFTAFPSAIFWPTRSEAYYLALCSGFAIAGQYCITFGYRYVTAVEGGIISSSRILLAAILGPFIAADPVLLLKGWFGAAIIMGVNILLAVRKARNGRTGNS
jgi:drug/metabolite transporter (DMT)-like permease